MSVMMRGGVPPGPQKPLKPDTVRRVIGTFRPYRAQVAWIALAVLAAAALGLLSPFFLRTIVNQGLLGARHGRRHPLHALHAGWRRVGGTALTLGYGYLSTLVGQHIMRDLRNQLYDHLQGMSLRFFTDTRTGEIQTRLANDVGGVQSVLSDTAANLLSNVTTVLSTLVAMIYMDWRLTLLSVGILPALRLGRRQGRRHGARRPGQSPVPARRPERDHAGDAVGVRRPADQDQRAARAGPGKIRAGERGADRVADQAGHDHALLLQPDRPDVLDHARAGLLAGGRPDRRARRPDLTLGTIVAFTALQSRLFFPLTGLLNVQVEVTSALALFDRIFEYLDLKQEITDAPDAVALSPAQIRGAVAFEHVGVPLQPGPGDADAGRHHVRGRSPASSIALVGPSGRGQDDADLPDPAPLRRRRGPRHHRRPRRPAASRWSRWARPSAS